jgi:hypothetical protein
MSLDDSDNALTWSCDTCSATVKFPGADFWSAWTELKRRGWSATRVDDGWMHECGRCCQPRGSVLAMPLAGARR